MSVLIGLAGGFLVLSLVLCGLYLAMNWKGGDE